MQDVYNPPFYFQNRFLFIFIDLPPLRYCVKLTVNKSADVYLWMMYLFYLFSMISILHNPFFILPASLFSLARHGFR